MPAGWATGYRPSELPVVATSVPGTAELVEDGVNGLVVEADNAETLTLALQRLLADEPLRTKMAHNARQRAETCFTWDAVVNGYEQLYLSAVS